jgi:hypothetical protein
MVRRLCLLVTAIAFSGSGLARADGDLGTNAALKYWQAFATLPKLTDGEEKAVVREANTMPLDAHVQELVKSAAYSLRLMHVGATVRPCDWSIVWKQEGSGTLLPQLSAARVLSALAVLRARISFDDGSAQAAVDDCVAALALARQVSLDGSLIGLVTGYGIEAHVSEALASGLPKLDAKALEELKGRLTALPSGSRPALAMMDAELNYVDWLASKAKATSDAAELQKLIIDQGLVPETKEERGIGKARALVEACGGTPAGFVQRLDEMRNAFATVAKLLDLPLGKAEREIDLATKSLQANPVFEYTFPSALPCRRAQARTDVRRALLIAAVEIQLKGRDALKEHLDPVMGVPFEMTPFDGGFELSSTWVQKPVPISLTVGKRAK